MIARRRTILLLPVLGFHLGIVISDAHGQSTRTAARPDLPAGMTPVGPPVVPLDTSPHRSLMAETVANATAQARSGERHGLRDTSMFAIAPPDIRVFKQHDIVMILVRETSRAKSTHELETEKEFNIKGAVKSFPRLDLSDLLQFQLFAGRTVDLPKLDVRVSKEFEGEGDYKRVDDLSARISAEVIDILPNGNLVLEARTFIRTDEETGSMRLTGICRPEDVNAANTVLSSQIHDLRVEKLHEGELKKTNEKGILSKILDTIFAF